METFERYINQIIEGDAIDILRNIPDETIDMAFADPPFNLGKKYLSYKDSKEITAYLEWCYLWLDELTRVLKPTGSLFVHNIPKWLTYFAAHLNKTMYFRHWIAWNAPGAPLGKTLQPNHYGVLFYTKLPKGFKFYEIRAPHPKCRECGAFLADYGGKKHLRHPFGMLVSDVWTDIHRIRHKKRRDEHPCQLPIPLLERLILMTTDEGDLVIDPFIGTGTTAIAAKRLGRQYIGIDIDPYYVQLSRSKFETAVPSVMNGVYISSYLGKLLSIRDIDYTRLLGFPKDEGRLSLPQLEFQLRENPATYEA